MLLRALQPVAALLILVVVAWAAAGFLIRPPEADPPAQVSPAPRQQAPEPEVEIRRVRDYSRYEAKDPFRQLIPLAQEESAPPEETAPPEVPEDEGDPLGSAPTPDPAAPPVPGPATPPPAPPVPDDRLYDSGGTLPPPDSLEHAEALFRGSRVVFGGSGGESWVEVNGERIGAGSRLFGARVVGVDTAERVVVLSRGDRTVVFTFSDGER